MPVPYGPRAYRRRIRALGPLVALLAPGACGLVAWWCLRDHTSALRGTVGFATAVLAAPGLVAAGVPLTSGRQAYLLAVAGSALLWLLLGGMAARRATRSPVATWADYWRELAWPVVGVWVGAGVSLVVANVLLGGALS